MVVRVKGEVRVRSPKGGLQRCSWRKLIEEKKIPEELRKRQVEEENTYTMPPGPPHPKEGSSEGAALTRGWLLMVRKPAAFTLVRCCLIKMVSRFKATSHQGSRCWMKKYTL